MTVTAEPVEPGANATPSPRAAVVEPVIEVHPHTETPGLLSREAAEPAVAIVEKPADPAVEAKSTEPAAPAEPAKSAEPAVETKPAAEVKAEPEVKPTEPAKPAEPAVEVKPTEPAVLEPLKYETAPTFPEGIVADPARIAEFDTIIGAHRLPIEARQSLVDFHVEELRRGEERHLAEQHRLFGETRKSWRDQIASDEELGGSAIQTNRAAAIRIIDNFVPEARRPAFEAMMRVTGVADHPEFMRFLVNLDKKFGAPPVPTPPNNPAPDRGGRPGGRRMRSMYDNTNFGR